MRELSYDFENPVDIYRYMIESSRDIVFLLDDGGRFVFLNDRVESLLGFSKQELISGYKVPTEGLVEWHLEDKKYPYWRAKIEDVVYE